MRDAILAALVMYASLVPSKLVIAQASPLPDGPLPFDCTTFTRDLTEAELITRYGQENVVWDLGNPNSQEAPPHSVIFPDSPELKFTVNWHDLESRSGPYGIAVRNLDSRWTSPEGISMGTDLLSVERANGWPFRLAGFASESSGAVRSWGNGHFAPSEAETPACRVGILFQHRWDGTQDPVVIRQVSSGPDYSSGHPAMQQLNPRVVYMWMRFLPRR